MQNIGRLASAAGAALALLLAGCGGGASGGDAADILITNGKVYTADGKGTTAEAVAVKDGKILKVGTNAEVAALKGAGTEVIDAAGGSVLPGFIDTHVHFLAGAQTLGQANISGARDAATLQEKLSAYLKAHPGETGLIRAHGYYSLDLTRQDMDPATGDRPAIIWAGDGHSAFVNSKALELAGITRDTKDPAGGKIVRDPKTGEPTGVLLETAQSLVAKLVPPADNAARRQLLAAGTEEALSKGVTTILNIGNADDIQLFDAARDDGTLGLRVYSALWLQPQNAVSGELPGTFAFSEADADQFDALRAAHRDDDWVRTGIVKIMLDGVIESHTAAMLAPYADRPGETGHANYTQAELDAAIGMMDRRGWQIMTHALGDRAVRMALNAYEKAAKDNPAPARGRRHKIEHIESIDAADVPRFAELGVTASLQPDHAGGMANPARSSARWTYLGTLRSAWGWPWKSIKEAGGRIAFGSDWPVATLDIGPGMWIAMNRQPNPPVPDQKLTVAEVIDGYTRDAAWSIFADDKIGTIEPGKLADIVVLQNDVFAQPPEKEGGIKVARTIVGGKVRYTAGQQ